MICFPTYFAIFIGKIPLLDGLESETFVHLLDGASFVYDGCIFWTVCASSVSIVWKVGPLRIFWMVRKARNSIVFRDDILSIQRLKFCFVNLLWSETKLSIEGGPTTLVQFIDWVGSNRRQQFFVPPPLCDVVLLRGKVFTLCTFRAAILASLL